VIRGAHDDLDSAFAWQVEENVAAKGKASQVNEQFWPCASDQGTPGKGLESLGRWQRRRRRPDADCPRRCRPKSQRSSSAFGRITTDGILLGDASAGGGALAALPFHFGHAPGAGRAAFQALVDVAPQPFELKSVQFVLRLHKAQGFAHHLAGGVIAPGFDFLANELFELRGQVDVECHGGSVRLDFKVLRLARIVND